MLHKIVSVVALTLFSVVYANLVADERGCPDNSWQQYDGVCYYFNFRSLTWMEAEKFCQDMNSHLTSIRDNKVNTYLKGQNVPGLLFWFGLSKNEGGRLMWTDKPHQFNTKGFSDWGTGEPNAMDSCATMIPALTDGGTSSSLQSWGLTACNKYLPSICALPAIKPQ